jgi:hypothetical protein
MPGEEPHKLLDIAIMAIEMDDLFVAVPGGYKKR